jgi:hypothetical protein
MAGFFRAFSLRLRLAVSFLLTFTPFGLRNPWPALRLLKNLCPTALYQGTRLRVP